MRLHGGRRQIIAIEIIIMQCRFIIIIIMGALELQVSTVVRPAGQAPSAAAAPPLSPARAGRGLLASAIFTDHAVLQAAAPNLTLFGWAATTGAKVTAVVAPPPGLSRPAAVFQATTGATGLWTATVGSWPVGVGYTITAWTSATDNTTVTDVAMGNVFVCGGQSNMQFTVGMGFGAEKAFAEADSKGLHLRLLTIANRHNNTGPQDEVVALPAPLPGWNRAGNASITGAGDFTYFSGACFFFGASLLERMPGVPVGLIASSWSGSAIEPWMPPSALLACNQTLQHGTAGLCGSVLPKPSALGCSSMYNSMIAPLQRFSVRAILWWQGEANGGEIYAKVGAGHSYECEQTAMIKAWREGWRAVAFEVETPFIFVLLEAFKRGYDKYNGPVNAIREQQLAALSLERVGMASAIDIADNGSPLGGIHPRNKPLIGYRLASVALSLVFGVPGVAANGPTVQSLRLISSIGGLHTLHLQFQFQQSLGDPLLGVPLEVRSTSDCETPYYFNYSAHCCAPAGESGPSPFSVGFNASDDSWEGFRPVSGWTVSKPGSWVVEITVTAAEKPVWLGLMWEPLPGCAVYNGAGLPAVPRLLIIKSDDDVPRQPILDHVYVLHPSIAQAGQTGGHAEHDDSAARVPTRVCDGRFNLVAVAKNGSASEQGAASLLATMMARLAHGGAPMAPQLKIVTPAEAAGKPHLAVGAGAAVALDVAMDDIVGLGEEGFVLTSNRTYAIRSSCTVLLAGAPSSISAPVYAAQELLRILGVRFLAWDATLLPVDNPVLPPVDMTFVPTFEYRDIDDWAALADPQQAQYLHITPHFDGRMTQVQEQGASVTQRLGGSPILRPNPYAHPPGFVHTSFGMLYDFPFHAFPWNTSCESCPPAVLYHSRPEWFWPRGGLHRGYVGQLCWSNASLVDYLTKAAEYYLSSQPNARIISISQNDNDIYCQSPEEMAIISEEGSPMGE